MIECDINLATLLPNTKYFEFDSKCVGSTLAIWVTTPSGYDESVERQYPVIFTPDGGLMAPISIPFVAALSGGSTGGDVVNPVKPYIQVTIGYCGPEDFSFRLRDLLPKDEPVPDYLQAVAEKFVTTGAWTREMADHAMKMVKQSPAAENFLSFIIKELLPEIASRWRVDSASTGFFGDSYGGLFAVWMALQRPAEIPIIGAGSPGIASAESKVFDLLKAEQIAQSDYSGRHLHISYPSREFEAPTYFQTAAQQYIRFLSEFYSNPLPGLKLTTHIVPYESHLTGLMPNFFSFLRACYSV